MADKNIPFLQNIYRISDNIYNAAKKDNNTIVSDSIPYYTIKISNDEIMMINKMGKLDPYYMVKLLKGVIKENLYCEEGTIYLEYCINEELSMWGLEIRKQDDKYHKFGTTDDIPDKVDYINEKLITLQRDSRINNILSSQ